MATEWQPWLLVALLAGYAFVTYRTYRRFATDALAKENGGAATVGSASAGDLVDRENDAVECPACGTENELGYRYCRACVEELPVATTFRRPSGGSPGRLPR